MSAGPLETRTLSVPEAGVCQRLEVTITVSVCCYFGDRILCCRNCVCVCVGGVSCLQAEAGGWKNVMSFRSA